MPRKPWIIVLLSVVYILSPLVILFSNSWMNLIPLWGESGIVTRLTPGDWFVLSLYLINGIAIFTVRKPAWWVFLISSAILIIYNLWGYLQNPLQSLPALLIYNIFLFSAATLIFRREVIAPYFNPRLRWWESDPRYSLDFYCTIDLEPKLEAPIRDISRGGCFVSTLQNLPLGVDIPMMLHLQKLSIRINARAIRRSQKPFQGWGLKFQFINQEEADGLDQLMKKLSEISGIQTSTHERREFQRITLPQWILWNEDGVEYTARLMNLSKTGCCLITEKKGFLDNREYHLIFPDGENPSPVPVRRVWEDRQGDQIRSGIQFVHESQKEKIRIRQLIEFYKSLGSEKRTTNQSVNVPALMDSLKKTPFPGLYAKGK